MHADTQGQSEPVFGLAHLLGIKLFPRMRNWNDVTFYRPELTDVLTSMAAEGWPLTKELVGRLSPYMREHLRRVGQYSLDVDDLPPPLAPKPLGIPS